jgi:hypothetical protein
MPIAVGDKIPDVEVRTMGADGSPQAVRTGEVLGGDNFQLQAVGIGKTQHGFAKACDRRFRVDLMLAQSVGPIVERTLGRGKTGRCDLRRSHTAAKPAGPGEERDDRARAPQLIAIVKVVATRIVEVDRQLDQPQAQHAAVKVDILLRVGRDGRHVMNSGQCRHDRLRSKNNPSPSGRGQGEGALCGGACAG